MSELNYSQSYTTDEASQRAFIVKVYGWMTAGLMITGIVAMVMAMNITHGMFAGVSPKIIILLMVVQLGIAIGMRWFTKMNAGVITAMYVLYAVITGVFFSVYLLIYTEASIASTFFICAGTFGAMSVYGMVTKRDLTSIGQFCMMAVIGLIIASVVNFFMQSSMLYWITAYAGVLIFVGLTAYDTQKMKYGYLAGAGGSAALHKAAILSAFTLYLDFIILFQYLLQILGRRK